MTKPMTSPSCLGSGRPSASDVEGGWVELGGERFYRIANVDRMPPFLISVVSASDHWMFVTSNGGITAGRRDADHAVFPYVTEDKIRDGAAHTGSRTIVWAERDGARILWEPFETSRPRRFRITRNLYKNVHGNRLRFEEINHDLELEFRVEWTTSDRYGIVKRSELVNTGPEPVSVSLLDGILNVLPWGSTAEFNNLYSCLADAYAQHELETASGLGIFAFTSIPSDGTEPLEALRANVCWATLPPSAARLISTLQLDAFRDGARVRPERRVCGKRGAYLVHVERTLAPGRSAAWHIVADVAYGHAEIALLRRELADPAELARRLEADIAEGTRHLERVVASADGLQATGDELAAAHHFANVLFNVMRGGTFAGGYRIPVDDLAAHVRAHNREVAGRHREFLASLGEEVELPVLLEGVRSLSDADLYRLVREYLPLSFSRRHGDPSRPWNRFSIELRRPDGRPALAYEGNWRDIFQNWEALCHAFPEFIESVIFRFLNTSTADGHNPYRISSRGYEWEVPSPGEPWANFGYWGDHQVVYLLRLLEMSRDYHPGLLEELMARELFVYAEVPYDIKPYRDLLADPKRSLVYNVARERRIAEREAAIGLDGRYAVDGAGRIWHVNLAEKLLVPLLAKVSNFVAGAGFWLNTQRPEWNDANNGLAGFGVSVVTLAHARRYAAFLRPLLTGSGTDGLAVSSEVATWLRALHEALAEDAAAGFPAAADDRRRRLLLDRLGAAAEAYRGALYEGGFSGRRSRVSGGELGDFLTTFLEQADRTLELNRRPDGLYHAYNVLSLSGDAVAVARLPEMLEGQVAALGSGRLDPGECVSVIEALRASRLYRPDQHSFMLYPARRLPSFLEKNTLPEELAARSVLLTRLLEDGNTDLVVRDVEGRIHFNPSFHNRRDVEAALDRLAAGRYGELVAEERGLVHELFEAVFRHREFIGRSGVFYAYEGLGCIYWHMVGKLLVAVQECCLAAPAGHPDRHRLAALYFDLRSGLGFNKTPWQYGAFPTDPYSHTPGDGGARQPGMTGQVKEEILTRRGELGLVVSEGRIGFEPLLLRHREFLAEPRSFRFYDVHGEPRRLDLEPGTLALTVCQVPFVLRRSATPRMVVHRSDGGRTTVEGLRLDSRTSREIFMRTGAVVRVDVHLEPGGDRGEDP